VEVHHGPTYYVDGVVDLTEGDLVPSGQTVWTCPDPACTTTEKLFKTQASVRKVMHEHGK